MLVLALGLTLNTKTGLGVSPIISVAFSVSEIWGLNFGDMTFLLYTLFVAGQLVLRGRDRRLTDLLQLPLSLVFSRVLNLYSALIPYEAAEHGFLANFGLLLAAIFFTGAGAAITVNMKLVPNPGDGIVAAVAERLGRDQGFAKNVFDVGCVAVTCVLGLLAAGRIVGIGVGELIVHLAWVTALMFIIGWILFVRPMKFQDIRAQQMIDDPDFDLNHARTDFWMSILPVLAVFVLMVFCGMGAAISMGLIAALMIPVLMGMNRAVGVKEVFIGAIEWKLLRDVSCILFFIQLLDVTGVLAQVVTSFRAAPLPTPVIIAGLSFLIGVLTGMSQGHVAIVMPIVALLAPQAPLDLVGVALVFGVGGQMVTPTHVCLIVTLDYFKADFFKTLLPVALAEALLLGTFSAYTYLTWN